MPLPCLPLLPTQPSSSRRKTPLSLKMFRFHGNRSWHHQNFLPSCTLPPPTIFNMFFFSERIRKNPKTTVVSQCSPLFPSELLNPNKVIWVEKCRCPCVHKQPVLQIQFASAPVPNYSMATGGCRFPDISSRLWSSPAVLAGLPLPLHLWLGFVCYHLFPVAMGAFGELHLIELRRAAS